MNILIENSSIKKIWNGNIKSNDTEVFDVQGRIAAPGLIDIHIQGSGSSDILDGTEEAINSASKNPAKLLNLNKGIIETGKDADIIILNNDYSLFVTIVNGKIVFKDEN